MKAFLSLGVTLLLPAFMSAVLLWASPSEGLLTLDHNGDREITYEEYEAGMKLLFKGADLDDNGHVDEKDYGVIMLEGDVNRDSWLSRTEYRHFVQVFNDTDDESGLSEKERDKLLVPGHAETIKQLLICCDTNRDRRVTRGEFNAITLKFFIDLDWDRDSVLLPEEADALPGVKSYN